MEKMSGKSLDLLEKNIDIIQKTFPEVMTEEEFNGKVERKIDFDKLRLLLGDDVSDREERYELRWNGKNDAIRFAQTPSNGTLRPDKESSRNWDDTENLYIEGDNLEVLKLLQKSYFGKIKMIYIDPPYNTGKDFVYKDDFKDKTKKYLEQTGQSAVVNTESNGRYHTDWLNMMYPRLKVSRNLLKDDGVIFISIDDNEVHNLRKICDEIFGEDNFISNICHKNRDGVSNDKIISSNHNHILFYAKNYSIIHSQRDEYGIKRTEEDFKNYNKDDFDGKGPYTLNPVTGPGGAMKGNPYYEVLGIKNYWRFGKERMEKMIKEGTVVKINNNLYQKTYKSNMIGKKKGATTWWDSVGTTASGSKEIKKLFNKTVFDYSKPTSLLEYIINYCKEGKDDIVLDFFSGSATTAHAVMQLNAEDGGNRKFIMVQLPEITPEKSEARKAGYENICEIGKERIRRAGDMIINENKDKEGIEDLDIGFKVFKLDSSNIKEWDPDYENLEYSLFERQDIIKMGRTNEDLLYEIIIKMGIEPTVGIEEIKFGEKIIYNIGMGALLICLEDEITEDLVAEIPNHKSIIDEMDTKVVFKESGFRTDSAKMNAIQKLKQFGITDVRSV